MGPLMKFGGGPLTCNSGVLTTCGGERFTCEGRYGCKPFMTCGYTPNMTCGSALLCVDEPFMMYRWAFYNTWNGAI